MDGKPIHDGGIDPTDVPAKSSLREGLVVSHLGKGLAVEAPDGGIVLCHTRRQLGSVAVGDKVLWSEQAGGSGRVETLLPRRSLLTRPAHGGRIRPVAANLDRLIIVVAPEPDPDSARRPIRSRLRTSVTWSRHRRQQNRQGQPAR